MNTLRRCFTFLCITFIIAHHHTWADGVAKDAESINPILVGQTLPGAVLRDSNNQEVKLDSLTQGQHSLLIFYRGGWCPYCNRHLAELRKIEPPLKQLGFQILAISPDLPKFLKATQDKQELNYKLLSDSSMAAAKALGLAFKVDDKTLDLYANYGIDLAESSGQSHHLLPVPAAILVNPENKISFVFAAPDYKTRVDTEVLLAAAKAQSQKPTSN